MWNAFDEPPPEFVCAFDIVHVRLVTVVIRENDPRPLLSNLYKLLSEMLLPFPCYVVVVFVIELSCAH